MFFTQTRKKNLKIIYKVGHIWLHLASNKYVNDYKKNYETRF